MSRNSDTYTLTHAQADIYNALHSFRETLHPNYREEPDFKIHEGYECDTGIVCDQDAFTKDYVESFLIKHGDKDKDGFISVRDLNQIRPLTETEAGSFVTSLKVLSQFVPTVFVNPEEILAFKPTVVRTRVECAEDLR